MQMQTYGYDLQLSWKTAFAVAVFGFRIMCASSSTTADHKEAWNLDISLVSIVYEQTTIALPGFPPVISPVFIADNQIERELFPTLFLS
jgi:hypothetical protein